ncbi:uncharacterized protein LOC117175690 [Belonocnema kinseyi]|uniref:uncharacterized protein LOC117175690 n=1 Tax=Belonocnema kinseyi TaxID=2817044 RepID=UPI00143DCC41|nr:uncharacterized protein LOC117175690 [Belonocnema kinseyi]
MKLLILALMAIFIGISECSINCNTPQGAIYNSDEMLQCIFDIKKSEMDEDCNKDNKKTRGDRIKNAYNNYLKSIEDVGQKQTKENWPQKEQKNKCLQDAAFTNAKKKFIKTALPCGSDQKLDASLANANKLTCPIIHGP